MDLQGNFDFTQAGEESGYTQWLAAKQIASDALARRMHLPIGHLVEVWLTGEVCLRGKLRLKEQQLFISEDAVRHLELMVDNVEFRAGEIDRCLRLD